MELTLGKEQVFTSKRMIKYPLLGHVFTKIFGYTNVGNYARFTIFKKLVNQLPIDKMDKVLDVGCGYGEYAIGLAKAMEEAEIHALDIDSERTETVVNAVDKSAIHNIQIHNRYLETLREEDFDFIYSIDVFEHMHPDMMPFKAARERLKEGGYFLVKIPNKVQKTILPEHWFEDHNHWLEEEHIGQVYDLDGLQERFVEEGFEIVSASHSDGWISRFAWELAYLGKKMGVITQLLTLPLSKLLIHADRIFHNNKWGNAIQVIGKKPTTNDRSTSNLNCYG
ncbi:class I SAM-dependent methyltransferase [Reichenbachiella versicolor]|uniref:class I SAM-dependent methyltransferase n=1 Tax=Reichenbachiella versicolor TaxID=1821036 RepID=UPI000D6E4E9E|nr:class I SAM-dependent methyltransferase [Reichenbachiella versicolor]